MNDKASSAKKKWQRKPEQRPDAILDSALLAFRSKGVAATKIEDIAKGAGLSKGAIYLYFDNKEAMLQALVKRAVFPVAERIETLAKQADQAQVLPTLQMIVALAGDKVLDPNFAAIPLLVISEAGRFPELARFYRTTVLERVIDAFAVLLKKGQQQGLFRAELNPHFAVRSLMGGIFLQLLWHHVFAQQTSDPVAVKQQLEHHLDLFLRGISR